MRFFILVISMDIKLILPAPEYEAQVMELRAEMLADGEGFDGCAGLDKAQSYAEWCDNHTLMKKLYGENCSPSDVFLAVRESDNKVVGIIDYRYVLSDFLLKYGGHTGYTVRRTERRKGYGSEMLRLLIEKAKARGEKRLLVTCDKDNEASRRTILKCFARLENEVADEAGLGKCGVIQRYWIEL